MDNVDEYSGTQASGLVARMRAKVAVRAETTATNDKPANGDPDSQAGFKVIAAPSELPGVDKPRELASYPAMPDEFYAGDANMFTYHFEDKNRLPIPNEMGWRVIKYLKPNCVQAGRPVIPHTDVNPILAQHSRDELAHILKINDDAWVPIPARPKKSPAP